MTTLTLPIQVGKKYVRRDGVVVRVRDVNQGGLFHTEEQGLNGYASTGRCSSQVLRPYDLVADYIEPAPAKGHVHATRMAEYALDAHETDKPWERWEYFDEKRERWCPINNGGHPFFDASMQYRRKPKTIRIGAYDVPEPLRVAPADGVEVFLVNPFAPGHVNRHLWNESASVFLDEWLAMGWYHLTREAAEIHAKALLSFTEAKS